MLITALVPKLGYIKAATIAKYAYDHQVSLKTAALTLGYINASDFDAIVDPQKMV
jgi:fumarate hydratase class II